jgi:hypothetical protein
MINDDEAQAIANSLRQFEPGFLPYPIFEQIARIVALPIIEFVPLRTRNGKSQVLLIRRPNNDPIFPNMQHTPGTVIRATDLESGNHNNWPAFERILHDELLDTKVGEPHYAGSMFHASKRGAEQAQIYWIEVLEEPKVGEFFDVVSLPDGLMESQLKFIKLAASSYESATS